MNDLSSLRLWKAVPEVAPEDEIPYRERLGGLSRRDLLRYMGGSLALAGLAGCRGNFMPQRQLVPYVEQPPEAAPGQFVYFRTATVRHGHAFGLHVATREGRPIKIEGNPDHPASRGTCDAVTMAETLAFYVPDRAREVRFKIHDAAWSDFLPEFHRVLAESKGDGVRLLTGVTSSPTLERQIAELIKAFPGLQWHRHEPLGRQAVYSGTTAAFGRPLAPIFRVKEAKTVVLVDYDFDRAELGAFRYASELVASRSDGRINRIYAVYTMPGLAAGFADHPRAMKPSDILRFAGDLARGASDDPWTRAVLADLTPEAALVIGGEYLNFGAYTACCLANARLKAPVDYIDPPTAAPDLPELVDDMKAGEVKAILMSGVNPVYDAPPDLDFAGALAQVPFKACHCLQVDETALACDWQLPATHSFEHWTDARAFNGAASIAQPLIEPLYDGRSLHQILGALLGDERPPIAILQDTWQDHFAADFEKGWREAVHSGVVPGTASKPVALTPIVRLSVDVTTSNAFEINVKPDPFLGDGSRANNGWLMELPRPVTGLTWDNGIHLSPATAVQLQLTNGDHLQLGPVQAPVWITPGHADGCATVFLGYGRRAGLVATGVGFDAYPLTSRQSPFAAAAQPSKVLGNTELVTTQRFTDFAGREPVREYAFDHLPQEQEDFTDDPTLYDLTAEQAAQLGRPQWGMSIDLNRCIGCGACVAACVAENNIPVVGREQVRVGRNMHWIRIDAYHAGPQDNPRTFHEPVTCMHCETAPCEVVCPVAATVHSHEGLNEMIYNRCVGTRYCSNNCPYKVRHFNFLDYETLQPNFQRGGIQQLRLLNNPDVTVRSRGVMEKCTYCVQRINRARIHAKEENRPIADGEVVPACQQACPTQTIVFGDIADPGSRATKLRGDVRTYALLKELNTRPRTTYLAKLRNLNPAIPEGPNA